MSSSLIDLAAPFFWLFLGSMVLLLTPLVQISLRRGVLAAANLAFITILLGGMGAAAVLLGCLLLHGAERFAVRPSPWRWLQALALSVLGAALAALFYFHKTGAWPLPGLPVPAGTRALLTGLGFSYLALRIVEYLRAGAEGKTQGADVIDLIRYLLPFHMLAAGPIQSWEEFRKQAVVPASLRAQEVLAALERIVHGLFKKFVLARAIEIALLTGFRGPWQHQLLEVQFYYLWIYLDFSAYSDIAVGAGRLLGVATPENFANPLGARNIIAFWERWHISLSSFIRRNVFLPIQLNLMRTTDGAHALRAASLGLFVAFLLCGIWHGISPLFLLWGLLHALAVILCNAYRHLLSARLGRKGVKQYLEQPLFRILSTALTFEFVAFSLAFLVHPATRLLE
jgi:alginate O-acetyltransferase complex protein AlgI